MKIKDVGAAAAIKKHAFFEDTAVGATKYLFSLSGRNQIFGKTYAAADVIDVTKIERVDFTYDATATADTLLSNQYTVPGTTFNNTDFTKKSTLSNNETKNVAAMLNDLGRSTIANYVIYKVTFASPIKSVNLDYTNVSDFTSIEAARSAMADPCLLGLTLFNNLNQYEK